VFTFHVLGGGEVRAAIDKTRPEIFDRVRDTYLAHHRGETVNPNSYFLRFPDRPRARIIALPAALRGPDGVAGIKWIGSFPDNVPLNIPRASAVLVLNDLDTGYPFACLEASQISAARTAASAVLGAEALQGSRSAGRVAVIGAGVISRTVVEFLDALGWSVGEIVVFDTVPAYADNAVRHASRLGYRGSAAASLEAAVLGADLVVLATTAAEPHLLDPGLLAPGQNVLNISLRDLGPELIAGSHNILDDVEHCLNAGTSPHLAVQRYGHRDFIDGTLAELLLGEITLGQTKPRVFSPFGLGVLDLAVGVDILLSGLESGGAVAIPDFFAELERW